MRKSLTVGTNIYISTLYRFVLALLLLWLTRFGFIWYNHDVVGEPSVAEALRLSMHGLHFDLSAALYFNALFIAMRILPFGFVYNRIYLRISDWVYWICNGIMLAINVGDTPYYRFTGARLRWSNVLNVTTDSEIGNIVGQYAGSYWWAFVAGAAVIALLVWLSLRVRTVRPSKNIAWPWRTLLFLVLGGLCALGMRGRVGSGIPLAIPDAAFVVKTPPEINAVLNSPFTILRSLNVKKSNREAVLEFFDAEELAAIRTSVHKGAAPGSLDGRNVLVIIIESGGAEWVDTLSASGRSDNRGLMPFLDSLASRSLVVQDVIASSRSSCGGATSVLMGFPAFDPFYFMLSPYNKNVVDSPARLLAAKGRKTTFYYGCKHGSFNIDQTAFASGLTRVIDREAYGNDADFDGVWGIFDEPMGEYVAKDLTALGEPFFASWFTVSAHGPFTLPEGWDTSMFRHPEASPERGLEYTDYALRRFFEFASRQPWYANTTFVITADHGNRDFKGTAYDNDYLRNRIPFIVYAPDGSIEPGRVTGRVGSQFDIPATILGLTGYDEPYVSVGSDMLSDGFCGYGLARTDGGSYVVVGPKYTIYTSTDVKNVVQVYDTQADPLMTAEAVDYDCEEVAAMLRWAQAFLQDYTTRLNGDKMTIGHER